MKRATREIIKLNRIRLDVGLSYQELADEIGIPLKTLHRLLTDTTQQRCFDRTHHRILEFLKRFEAHDKRLRARRARASSAPASSGVLS